MCVWGGGVNKSGGATARDGQSQGRKSGEDAEGEEEGNSGAHEHRRGEGSLME